MHMENQRVMNYNNNGNGHYNYNQFANFKEKLDPFCGKADDDGCTLMSTTSLYSFPSPSRSSLDCIVHPVSRFDTLAGVAIKYGVEVADIKKMNGLVTDLQMFALESLQIPLPGKHPPSPCLSNGHDNSRQKIRSYDLHSDIFDSFQSLRFNSSQRKVSPAMSSLQGYYGLKPSTDPKISEAFETGYARKRDSEYLRPFPASITPLRHHHKSRSLVNCLLDENNGLSNNRFPLEEMENDSEKWNEKLIRRRQKSEADFTSAYPETLLRDDSCGACVSSAITGKSLALRSKAVNRTVLTNNNEVGALNDSRDEFPSVRKSSSTSSLQDQDCGSSSIRPTTKWNLKPDLQTLSAAGTRPIFDGLPKPISRRNKAALD